MCGAKVGLWGVAPTPDGDRLKEEGMEHALTSGGDFDACSWKDCVINWVARNTVRGQHLTGEWVRFHAAEHCGHPRHVNAWSAIINVMATKGLLQDTGLMRKPSDRKSHGRPSKIWMRV